MNDACFVGHCQAGRNGQQHLEHGFFINWPRTFLDEFGQGEAVHIVHHQIRGAVMFAEVEHAHQAGMMQLGGQLGFATKTLAVQGVFVF